MDFQVAVIPSAPLGVEQTRAGIYELEDAMLRLPQVELNVKHLFAPGVYIREMFIPKGVLMTGALHRHKDVSIISQGRMSVLGDDGILRQVQAPCTIITEAGLKKVGYAHEDTIWTTIHQNPDNLTDIDELEAMIAYPADYRLPIDDCIVGELS